MSSNVTYNGQTFNGVNGVKLPLAAGSGYAEFVEGGGGASNVVVGSFIGTEAGIKSITVPYSGNGYPIAFMIFPDEGAYNDQSGSNTFYSLVHQNAVACFCAIKSRSDTEPNYTTAAGINNAGTIFVSYKSSNSSSNSYSEYYRYNNGYPFVGQPEEALWNSAKMLSATNLSVYIANTSYGYAQNIKYNYIILYSE